ncbi:MAG: CHAT domain-containing protein [Mariprofundales bacterium]|nr:CHAT domain-containing protein [Mariprofundales bacterium]
MMSGSRLILTLLLILLFAAPIGARSEPFAWLPDGGHGSMQPLPLPDGGLLFVSNHRQNMDIMRMDPSGNISPWEHHPADERQPTLSPDGKLVAFISTRTNPIGQVWIKPLAGGLLRRPPIPGAQRRPHFLDSNTLNVEQWIHHHWRTITIHLKTGVITPTATVTTPHPFTTEHPFDTNGDGVVNSADDGWIIDQREAIPRPITPLALDAADPIYDARHHRLWFTLHRHSTPHVAAIELKPGEPIHLPQAMASAAEWRLLHWMQPPASSNAWRIERNERLWLAGWPEAVRHRIGQSAHPNVQQQWMRLRLRIHDGAALPMSQIARLEASCAKQDPHYRNRMRLDVATWLSQRGQGVAAIKVLQSIQQQPWLRSATMLQTELLLQSGDPDGARITLTHHWKIVRNPLNARLRHLIVQIGEAGSEDPLMALTTTIHHSQHAPPAMIALWRLRQAQLLQQRGDLAAAIDHLKRVTISQPAIKRTLQQRQSMLYRQQVRHQLMKENARPAASWAQRGLQQFPNDPILIRLWLQACASGKVMPSTLQWQAVADTITRPVVHQYAKALWQSYHATTDWTQAERALKLINNRHPTFWPARQTLGWLLAHHRDTTSQRRALALYSQALRLLQSNHGDANDLAALYRNTINLAFQLHLNGEVLVLLGQWWNQNPHAIGQLLLLQGAHAALSLTQLKTAQTWLRRLPTLLPNAPRRLALHLHALIAVAQHDHGQAIHDFDRLLMDRDLTPTMRQRLQLDRALELVADHRNHAAIDALTALLKARPLVDPATVLRMDGITLTYNSHWIAHSLLAMVATNQQKWYQALPALRQRLRPLKTNKTKLTAIIFNQLAQTQLRLGRWQQASASFLQAANVSRQAGDRVGEKHNRNASLQLQMAATGRLSKKARAWLAKQPNSTAQQLILLAQPFATVLPSLEHARNRVVALHQRITQWRTLVRSRAGSPQQPLVRTNFANWLRHHGLHQAATQQWQRVASDSKADPWLRWNARTALEPNPTPARVAVLTRQLSSLVNRLTRPLPFHLHAIDHYFQQRARTLLAQDAPNHALNTLMMRDILLSRARQHLIDHTTMHVGGSIRKIRRQLHPDQSMVVWWRAQRALWILDHNTTAFRHLRQQDLANWADITTSMGGKRKRILLVELVPRQQDIALLQRKSHAIVQISPTMLAAPRIGDVAANPKLAGGWKQRLWERADRALRDWRWHLKAGIHAYRQRQWRQAWSQLTQALSSPELPAIHRDKLQQMTAQAALNMNRPDLVFTLTDANGNPSGAFALLLLQARAKQAEQRGLPLTAAGYWQQMLSNAHTWPMQVTAVKGMARIAQSGVLDVAAVRSQLQQLAQRLPAKATPIRASLLLDDASLAIHRQPDQANSPQGWNASLARAQQAQSRITAPALAHQLTLLRIVASWKRHQYQTSLSELDTLGHQINHGDPLQIDIANLRGLVLQSMGQYLPAKQALQHGKMLSEQLPTALSYERLSAFNNNLGRLALDMGDAKAAAIYFQRAMEIDHHRHHAFGLAYDYRNLARLSYQQGNISDGDRQSDQAIAQAKLTGLQEIIQEVRLLHALAHPETNPTTMTKRAANTWRGHWIQARQALHAHHLTDAVASYQEALFTLAKHDENSENSDAAIDAPIRLAEESITAAFATHDAATALWMGEIYRQMLQRRGKQPLPNRHQFNIFLQRQLHQHHQPILIYFSGRQHAWVWLLHHGTLRYHLLPSPKQWRPLLTSLKQGLIRHTDIAPLAHQLFKQLWRPLAMQIPDHGTLTVVSSGTLDTLPFSLLADANHPPLLTRYALQYSPQLLWPTRAITGKGVLLAGNAGVAPSPLLLVANELNAVRDFGAPGRVDQWPNIGVQTLIAQMHGKRALHLAAHAIHQPHLPRFSYLLLPSTDDSHRSRLYARDIFALHQPAPAQVILTSCGATSATARDPNIFAHAFLAAGSLQVVANQWQSSDLTSALFAKWLAQAQRRYPLAEAIRHTRIQLAKRFSHAGFWAGFRLWVTIPPDGG